MVREDFKLPITKGKQSWPGAVQNEATAEVGCDGGNRRGETLCKSQNAPRMATNCLHRKGSRFWISTA